MWVSTTLEYFIDLTTTRLVICWSAFKYCTECIKSSIYII